ncbi:MAG: hypothetical protein J6Y04_03640 [Bacteroidaceae bacterium]|nr:hypothetical protein [Bacteroidaceae bacterium]
MRKLYSLILLVMMMGCSVTAMAWSYDLSLGNDVLTNQYGYMLYKDYDFYNGNCNVNDVFTRLNGERCYGDGCFTLATDKASFKLNGFDTYQVTEPVEMSNFYVQIGTAAINLRAGVGKSGLHNYGSGSRFFAIGDVKAGQIIVCQWGITSSRESVVQPASAISGATACTFTDLTADVHAAQIEMQGTDDASSDAFSYWRAESDGYFVVEMQRDACIQGIQIWIDASADEAVSAPSMTLKGVNLSERQIELTPGESTMGYDCVTYYGIVDRGEKALFLIDSDEIEKEEDVDILDEEGNVIGSEHRVTYKQIIDPEEIANGTCGENRYDGSYIVVNSNDDEDGDGYVTIAAATVSESYKFSDIVTINVSVNEITLNAPTMSLTGLNGTIRQYQVGWANNTLCGEDYELIANVDGDERPVTVGEFVEAEVEVGARVHAEGYLDGVLEVTDVLEPAVEFSRKNQANAEAEKHDWDFVNLPLQQKFLLKHIYSDPIGVVDENTGDTIRYAFDDFAKQVEEGTLMENQAITLDTIPSGWAWDSGRARGTLEVNRDTTWTSDTEFTVTTTYVEEKLGIYPETNGLTFECAPNSSNNSTVLMYSNGDLGLYFMSRPTLTFSREAATYGEYVLVYQGAGGSNYTNSRWPTLYAVPADELLTFQLQNGGIHVFYIDVYTREDLPADGIEEMKSEELRMKNAIFDLSGRRVSASSLQKGVYIKAGKKYFVK